MKTLATIGDNCVDIYPQLNKAFSGGNAVNVAVYCTRYGIQPGCITWVGDDDYGTKLKQDLARMGVDISHVHTKHGVTAQTQVELHDNDRVFGDYTEGVMADFALSEEDYAWLAQYDIVHAAIWGHAEDAFPQLHAAGKLPLSTSPTSGTARSGRHWCRISILPLPPHRKKTKRCV